ncbi:MAG: SDR family oxidoreductase [Parachlamydia sp.]|nr:SDR family oxidoreductase [Parachlamydia sp.]
MIDSKVAIVTGGGHGIGAEIVRHLLVQGMCVIVADLKPYSVDIQDPTRILCIKTDVKREASIKNMIRRGLSHFGRIDCLINNAGLLPSEKRSFENTTLKIWNDYIATNLTGAFICSKHAAPYLKKYKGTIINMASTRAFQSEGNNEPYAASKGGLVSLTHELAITLGPDIRVNCISPGWIQTHREKLRRVDHSQHPVGRVGKPEDVANLVSFLMSEQAAFITGQNFVIDGGMTVKMIYM